MQRSDKLWVWIYEHKLRLAIFVLAVSFGWSYIMPPHLNSYDLLLQWSEVGFVPLGVLNIPFAIIGRLIKDLNQINGTEFYDLTPSLWLYVVGIAALASYGLFVGRLLEAVLRSRKRWLKVLFILNSLLGSIVFLTTATALYGRSGGQIRCDHSLSQTVLLRVIRHENNREEFVLKFDGESWEHLFYSGNLHCDQLSSLSEEFFWLWDAYHLIMTHDGGDTWQTWKVPRHFEYNSLRVGLGRIESMIFENEQNGEISVTNYTVPNHDVYFATVDGGQTWQMVETSGLSPAGT